MKKLIISILILIFFVISCSSSKKADNDTDILPDEYVADVDGTEENDDEAEEKEEKEDADADESIHCDTNPCKNLANVDGTCTDKDDGSFECGCLEGYFWANPGCKKITYANICTGQTKCYNNKEEISCPDKNNDFYGQDAQYAKAGYCYPQSFTVKTVSGKNIVVDNNTGLEWQQTISEDSFIWKDEIGRAHV